MKRSKKPTEYILLKVNTRSEWDAHQFMITKDGIAQYKAYGKHTAEEFCTEEFNLDKLISKL